MKKLFVLALSVLSLISVRAADTVYVKSPQIPVLIERHDNVLAYMRLNAKEAKYVDGITLQLGENVNLSDIKSLKLYYSGTEAPQDRPKIGRAHV